MDDHFEALKHAVPLQAMLGYVNFSEGKPDPRFQRHLSDCYAALERTGAAQPWRTIRDVLVEELERLHQGQSSAFRDIDQARAVLRLTFDELLPAYRKHHADLLFHQAEGDLFQPFFLARSFESVLGQRGPWFDVARIVGGAMRQLNDYVGHRPVAILESRPRGDPYDHERFRPVPLFIKGTGTSWGCYQPLIDTALEIVNGTDPGILHDAYLDPELLDELALDVRGYDFGHPADKRPNYIFGEWDPQHIDNQGRYRRFVVRQVVLDGLLARAWASGGREAPDGGPGAELRTERLWEAGAVLAGTMLMAAGVSGAGPETHDSSTTLSTLIPRIAQYRETFYQNLLRARSGEHGDRLRREAATTRQPFGGVRQSLNQFLARQRAWQLQQRHLALLFAEIGYPGAGRRQAAQIPVVSVRLLTEMHVRLSTGRLLLDRGDVEAACKLPAEIEALLHRGIACGALMDPWNILGFQGQYPRFTAMEDSVRDHRSDELVGVVEGLLSLYAEILSEGAALGRARAGEELGRHMRKLADWWDRFATLDVSDVAHVNAREASTSAEHVARALARWHGRGEAASDLAFWRQHLDNFTSPKAFALVVNALLRKDDYRAAMALLMTWLGHAAQVPLEGGEHSFHSLALRWMLGVCGSHEGRGAADSAPATSDPALASTPSSLASRLELAVKFMDYLEANAEEYWNVPRLDVLGPGGAAAAGSPEPEENIYQAAYEDVTYKDTTADDVESEVLDIMPEKDFSLSSEAPRLEDHLKFLDMTARLWNIAARAIRLHGDAGARQRPADWWRHARDNRDGLLKLLDAIHDHDIPTASGSYESLVEYDRRRTLKESLLGMTITTCLHTTLAEGSLRLLSGSAAPAKAPDWEPALLELEEALFAADGERTTRALGSFMEAFRQEPLLFRPLDQGGHPRDVLRASFAQSVLYGLATNLPRLGLIRDTFLLARTALETEQAQEMDGPRVTGFDRLFHAAGNATVEAVLDAAAAQVEDPSADSDSAERLASLLEKVVEPFLSLWIRHSNTLRLSAIEAIADDAGWNALRAFIERYGKDLFTQRFLTLGNIRGILHRGVDAYLDYLEANPDPLHPLRLIEEMGKKVPRQRAEQLLETILKVIIDNYEEYRDYNATTTQSDFGDNLWQFFEFLRLRASYDRNAWQLRPLDQVHELLVRRQPAAAAFWREQVEELTRELADEHLKELTGLQREYGMHLRTIADRLGERFVKQQDIERLCALIEPAMERAGISDDTVLEQELAAFSAEPVGSGLDVPAWLRRLETEVQRVRHSRTDLARLAEQAYPIPKKPLTLEQLRNQMQDWEKLSAE